MSLNKTSKFFKAFYKYIYKNQLQANKQLIQSYKKQNVIKNFKAENLLA